MRRSLDLLRRVVANARFPGSGTYWERRYRSGGTSGDGSYGELAAMKAEILNSYVAEHEIGSVIELGCGDGNQLSLARYPRYIGLDVSPRAIAMCARRFADPTKSFFLYEPLSFIDRAHVFTADCAMSLDVIFHLVEDAVYAKYLADLFGAAREHVVIYSSNREHGERLREAPHVRHRPIVRDIAARFPGWRLDREVPNRYPERSFCGFFMFRRCATS